MTKKKKVTGKRVARSGETDWRGVVGADPTLRWGRPVAAKRLASLERLAELPAELRHFLLQHDGLTNDTDDSLVMPAEKIEAWTRECRDLYADWKGADADRLLMFGDWPGNGDFFAYVLEPKARQRRHEIVLFDHETGRARKLAPDLAALLRAQRPPAPEPPAPTGKRRAAPGAPTLLGRLVPGSDRFGVSSGDAVVLAASGDRLAVDHGTLDVYDLPGLAPTCRLDLGEDTFARRLDLSPDGTRLAVAVSHAQARELRLFDVSTGKLTAKAPDPCPTDDGLLRFLGPDRLLAWAEDGAALLDAITGRVLKRGTPRGASGPALSPDRGLLAACAEGGLLLMRTDSLEAEVLPLETKFGFHVRFSPDGARLLARGNNAGVLVLDVASRKVLWSVGPSAGITARATFADPAGRTVAIPTVQGKRGERADVHVHRVDGGKARTLPVELERDRSQFTSEVAFAALPGGGFVGRAAGNTLGVWNADGTLRGRSKRGEAKVIDVFAVHGDLVVTGPFVHVWDLGHA